MVIEFLKNGWPFLVWWVLASILGYSIGFPYGLAMGKSLFWGWMLGGLGAGVLQYLLLRNRLAQAEWWPVVTLVGLAIGSGVSFVISQVVIQEVGLTAAFISIGASVGIGVGIAQWIKLRLHLHQAGWWILTSTAGYSLGVLAAVNAPVSIPVGRAIIFGPEFGGLIGSVSGIITGLTLLWLLQRPILEPGDPATPSS